MFELHLEIDEVGRAAFRADAPETAGAPSAPLRCDALLDAAREVVWYKDGFEQNEPQGDDALLRPTMPNLMMFLSDVRGRRFKAGVFLGEEVLAAAALFRVAAGIVCAGRYLPALVEEGGGFAARWRPVAMLKGLAPRETAFVARCVDSLVRRARRTALEDDDGRHETVHDAWIAALRSESGRLAWSGEAEARALMRDLASWKAPLAVSAADRAALHFATARSIGMGPHARICASCAGKSSGRTSGSRSVTNPFAPKEPSSVANLTFAPSALKSGTQLNRAIVCAP